MLIFSEWLVIGDDEGEDKVKKLKIVLNVIWEIGRKIVLLIIMK